MFTPLFEKFLFIRKVLENLFLNVCCKNVVTQDTTETALQYSLNLEKNILILTFEDEISRLSILWYPVSQRVRWPCYGEGVNN